MDGLEPRLSDEMTILCSTHLKLNVVIPHSVHDPRQNVADSNVLQLQRPRKDVPDDTVHRSRKPIFIRTRLGSSRPLHHQFTSSVPLTLANSPEQVQEILEIQRPQRRTQPAIKKHQVRSIPLVNKLVDSRNKLLVRHGQQIVAVIVPQRLVRFHDGVVRKWEEGSLEIADGGCEEALFARGFDEFDEDVSRVEVDVDKVVDGEHCLWGERRGIRVTDHMIKKGISELLATHQKTVQSSPGKNVVSRRRFGAHQESAERDRHFKRFHHDLTKKQSKR